MRPDVRAVRSLLAREIVPVVGCTEPACVAFAVAAARRRLGRGPRPASCRVTVALSREVRRNAATAVVPVIHRRGIAAAAAAGLLCSADRFNPFRGLAGRRGAWGALLRNRGWLTVVPLRRRGLYVRATVVANGHRATAVVSGRHDRLRLVRVDGTTVYRPARERGGRLPGLPGLIRLAARRDPGLERIAVALLRRQVRGRAGLTLPRRVADLIRRRMTGSELNVLTVTGSGNQGMFLALPLRELVRRRGRAALPAAVLALLVQVWQTNRKQRLAHGCGLATKAGPALAAGLAYAGGADRAGIRRAMRGVADRFGTMVCPGAVPGCGRKAERILRHLAATNRA